MVSAKVDIHGDYFAHWAAPAAQMHNVVQRLSDDDTVAIAAYLASSEP